MADPIRPDERGENVPSARDEPTDTPTLLTQVVRLAVGLGMLPLIGFGLLSQNVVTRKDMARDDVDERESSDPVPPSPPQPRNDDHPSQADVEAALRKLTAATLPRGKGRKGNSRE